MLVKRRFEVECTTDEQILMELCRTLKAVTIKVVKQSEHADKPSITGLGIDVPFWGKTYEIGASEQVLANIDYEYHG